MYRRLSQILHMLLLKQELQGASIAMKNAIGAWMASFTQHLWDSFI